VNAKCARRQEWEQSFQAKGVHVSFSRTSLCVQQALVCRLCTELSVLSTYCVLGSDGGHRGRNKSSLTSKDSQDVQAVLTATRENPAVRAMPAGVGVGPGEGWAVTYQHQLLGLDSTHPMLSICGLFLTIKACSSCRGPLPQR
jgi:hypothetical protein